MEFNITTTTLSYMSNDSFRENSSSTIPAPDLDMGFYKFTDVLNTYFYPIIFIMGMLGNTMCFAVFVGTHLNRQSSSVYLAFLAAIDNVILIMLFLAWFGMVGIHIFHRNGWCQCIHYCTFVSSFLAVWTVLSVTIERYIAMFFPLHRQRICTRKKAALLIVILTCLSVLFYSFSIVTYGVIYTPNGRPICSQLPQYSSVQRIMTSVDTIVAIILPTIGIVTLNIAIGVKVYNYSRRALQQKSTNLNMSDFNSSTAATTRSRKQPVEYDSGSSRHYHSSNGYTTARPNGVSVIINRRLCSKRHISQMRITRALLVVSSVFIILNLPNHALHILAFVMSFKQSTLPLAAYTWMELLHFLYYLSFSGNFILYMLLSRKFRNAFRRLLRRTRYDILDMKVFKYILRFRIPQ